MLDDNRRFHQRRPFLFGLLLILTAMILFSGIMAVFRSLTGSSRLGARIGVATVEGLIADSREVTEFLKELRENPAVKAVVLRVNSPGGVVGPSQEIHRAVARLAKEKPVVVSMGALAASGGYYVSCPAARIVANPGTITGSIGVKMELANVEDLAGKLGVGQEVIASGPYKGAISPLRKLTPEARGYLEAMVMDMHEQFVTDVAASRQLDPAKVRALADGRAMTGRRALEEGLVDELGGYEEALDRAKSLAGLTGEPELVKGPKKNEGFFLKLVDRFLGGALGEAAALLGHGAPLGPRWLFLLE